MPTSFGNASPCFKEIAPTLETHFDVFGNRVLERRHLSFEDAIELHEMAERPPTQQELTLINSLFAFKRDKESVDQ